MMSNVKFTMTKVLFVAVVLFSSMVSVANAQPIKSDNVKKIEYVDNTKGIVVIGDQEFRLRLNTKVSDRKKRKLNRYALKVGQSVKYTSSYENKKNYIDSIFIVSN